MPQSIGNFKFEHLQNAFKTAAKTSGVSFDFLVKTAARESGFSTSAKAKTSSAAGLFQFIEQTWLGVVSKNGAKYGLAAESASIKQSANGKFTVSDAATRNRILGLRHDPNISTAMAAELTAENQTILQEKLGRKPSDTELYIAHFLGAGRASEFLQALQTSPEKSATQLLPAEAKANPAIFKNKNGQARTVAQVFEQLNRLHGTETDVSGRTISAANGDMNTTRQNHVGFTRTPGMFVGSPFLRLSPVMVQLLAELSAPKAPDEPAG